MKKYLIALFLLAFLTAPAQAQNKSVLDSVLAAKKIQAAWINYPPSMIADANTQVKSGIMNDVITEIAKNMDLKLQYGLETTWSTMIESVETRQADIVVSGIWPSSVRALRADFTSAVYYSPVYAYVRADDTRFDGHIDRANNAATRIATIDGEMSATIASEDFQQAKTQSLPQQTDVAQLLLQLTTKKADLTFVEPSIAEAYLAKNPGTIKRVEGTEPIRLFPNTFLIKKGETGFRDALNIGISELQNSGEIERILKKYDPSGKLFVPVRRPVSP